MRNRFMVVSMIIFIIVLILFVILYLRQRHLIYFPIKIAPQLEDYQAQDLQVVKITTQDNLELTSWYKPAQDNQPTVLYLHGNAGHIGYRVPQLRKLATTGIGVLLLEYRGYGGNQGSPTEQGLYEDGRAGITFLQQNGVSSKQLVLYGESLGTGVATQLAVEFPVCAVILQSPYTSLGALSKYHYPWILVAPWDHFDSLSRIASINAPLLILHGKRDPVVPYDEGLMLFQNAKEPKKMSTFETGDHSNLWSETGYAEKVTAFIHKHCS